jgi:hypothetical protein
MTRNELVKQKLEATPQFRERRHRDHFLNILAGREIGMIEGTVKSGDVLSVSIEKLKKFGSVYGSYERAWRQVTEQNVDLRGTDYSQKEELEQEKKMELGYESQYKAYTPQQAEKYFNEL